MAFVTGYHSAVLCVVLLSVASYSTLEQYEAEMERFGMHCIMDGSSNSLADVGLSARVQRQECSYSAVVGEHTFLVCKYMGSFHDYSTP